MKLNLIFLVLITSCLSTLAYAETKKLTMGIFPYASSSKLIAHQKNIKKHLNKDTQYSFSLVSASDVPTYISNLKNYKYDLIYSAPHLARYIEKKYGYQRVIMTSNKIRGVLITRKKSNIYSLSDLKHKKLAMAPVKTILHQATLKQLNKNNLKPGTDVQINTVNTHSNALFMVINNESDAALTGIKLWKKLPKKHKKGLRKFAMTDPTTGFIVLAKPDININIINDMKKSFLSFNNTLAAKTYIFKGFKTITEPEMKSLDFHAKVFE